MEEQKQKPEETHLDFLKKHLDVETVNGLRYQALKTRREKEELNTNIEILDKRLLRFISILKELSVTTNKQDLKQWCDAFIRVYSSFEFTQGKLESEISTLLDEHYPILTRKLQIKKNDF